MGGRAALSDLAFSAGQPEKHGPTPLPRPPPQGGRESVSLQAARARVVARIRRMEQGNPGDARSVGEGVMEMRIPYGPGYRVYYLHRGAQILILLCGGDKRTQRQDIKRAQTLAETL